MSEDLYKMDLNINNTMNSDNNSSEICDKSFGPTIMNLNEFKAGMNGFDSNKINKIIHETSKGSHFHTFQTKRQQRIDKQIEEMKKKLNEINENERRVALTEVNKLCETIEEKRILTRIIVHFDLDMFFAAVEIKMRPELADKPVAVGSEAMIATSNYIARKSGVRAAMPGFVAKQLCPQLILIKHNFGNYSRESEAVMRIISQFDPNFTSFSLDEAFIDLTNYVIDLYSNNNPDFDRNALNGCEELPQFLWDFAFEVVQQIRDQIYDSTQLTASAGISCNTMIAKVCTDVKKPNGQYMVRGYLPQINDFLAQTQVRKICGIGPVRGQFLTSLGFNTCEDLWTKRDIIQLLFSQFNVHFYMRVALGVGTVFMRSDESRKSMSCERTFWETCDFSALCDKLQELSVRLESDLKSENQSCKTVTLKLKRTTFEVSLKSQTIPNYTSDSETIYNVAKALLETELSNTEVNKRKYRLIGLKVSNLRDNEETQISRGQLTLSQIFKALKTNSDSELSTYTSDYSSEGNYANISSISSINDNEVDYYECSICEQKFEHKFLFECHENQCIDEAYNISANYQQNMSSDSNDNSEDVTTDQINTSTESVIESKHESQQTFSSLCPICSVYLVFKDNEELNRHIDVCLNKNTCLELTQVMSNSTSSENLTPNSKSGKRVYSETKANNGKSQKLKARKQSKVSNDSKASQKTIDFFFRSPQ